MDTALLVAFRIVAASGSITSAAARLGYTQSAVSRQIAALESELDAVLFERRGRGVDLTAEGRQLLPHAEAVLDRLDEARRSLDSFRRLGLGRIRIGAFPTAIVALIPRTISAFGRQHPGVFCSLVEATSPSLLDRLARREIDVAVISSSPHLPSSSVLADPTIEIRPLLTEKLMVAVASNHRLARKENIGFVELADEQLIAGSASVDRTLLRAMAGEPLPARIDLVVAEWTAKLGCVAAGLGVTLVPALAATGVPSGVALVQMADGPLRDVSVAAPTGPRRHPAIDALLDELNTQADAYRT